MISKQLQAIFFDFDGVLVDSNRIKTEAFHDLFQQYDQNIIEEIVAYHQHHGGISRIVKIQYAFDHIIQQQLGDKELRLLGETYSRLVIDKVVAADWIAGAFQFLEKMYKTFPLFVVSGTPQEELQMIIEKRGMKHYFNEIAGSPVRKPEHIRQICAKYRLKPARCLFIGDANTDYHAAQECHMPFIGIQGDYTFPTNTLVLANCINLYDTVCSLFPKMTSP